MVELFSKFVSLFRDPVLIAVVVSFGLTLFVVWKLFDKQYEFVKARLDMLLKENEDLRKQIELFRQENDRLRQSTKMISIVVEDLRTQPQKIEKQLAGIDTLHSQLVRGLTASEAQAQQLRSFLSDLLNEVSSQNVAAAHIQKEAFYRLEAAISNLAPQRELIDLIRHMFSALRDNQIHSMKTLEEIERQAAALMGKASNER
jgi:chromosome segregation ATPase